MKTIKLLIIYLALSIAVFASTDYLIVYHSSFTNQNGWQSDLKTLLEGQGHEVVFYSLSDGNTSSFIRSMISLFKNEFYRNLKYVLLIGKGKDNPIPQGDPFPVYNHTVNAGYGNYIPFYYYIDNNYWNKQIRDIPSDWQYVTGLDLLIGRVPASSVSDVENWVQKLETHYSQLTVYHNYNNVIRFFIQNNDNIDESFLKTTFD